MKQVGQMPEQDEAGIPPISRNSRRMYEYNVKKYNAAPLPKNWADDVKPVMPRPSSGKPRKSNQRQRDRTRSWKSSKDNRMDPTKSQTITDEAEVTPTAIKTKTERLVDEPLWIEGPMNGSHPVQRIYAHNLDFSTFPLLLERVYMDLETENSKLRREMPFCCVSTRDGQLILGVKHDRVS